MNALNQTQSVGGRNPALLSLEREFRRTLASEEGVRLARQAAHQVSGDWSEPRASAVLADAVARWLGRDVVTSLGFYANGGVAVEVFPYIGEEYLTFQGFKNADDMMAWCCERHRARFSLSKFAEFDTKNPGPRVTWGDVKCEEAAAKLAALLADSIDQDIARIVLGV